MENNKQLKSVTFLNNVGSAFYDGAFLGFFAMIISGSYIGAFILSAIFGLIGYLLKKKAKKIDNINNIKTWKCYYCGSKNEGKVCKKCNRKRKVCNRCGKDIERDTLYCSKCGKKIK